jgi:hypothetical protein
MKEVISHSRPLKKAHLQTIELTHKDPALGIDSTIAQFFLNP